MAFTDQQIRAMVKAGDYTDPGTVETIAGVLIARRDKIGRYYFSKILPLDRFEVRDGELRFPRPRRERKLQRDLVDIR